MLDPIYCLSMKTRPSHWINCCYRFTFISWIPSASIVTRRQILILPQRYTTVVLVSHNIAFLRGGGSTVARKVNKMFLPRQTDRQIRGHSHSHIYQIKRLHNKACHWLWPEYHSPRCWASLTLRGQIILNLLNKCLLNYKQNHLLWNILLLWKDNRQKELLGADNIQHLMVKGICLICTMAANSHSSLISLRCIKNWMSSSTNLHSLFDGGNCRA